MEQLTVTVLICAYTDKRLADIDAAVESLQRQTRSAQEIILSIDHNDALAAICEQRFAQVPGLRVVRSDQPKGLSGARNAGIAANTSDVILFLDDDATADEHWIEAMLVPMEADPMVLIVGGRTLPAWDTGRPSWFPAEFDWVVGATHEGVPLHEHEVRNPLGCNAGWRRTVFEVAGGFTTGVGRVGNDAAGCEETELAIRLRQARPEARVVFTPDAVVRHRVTTDREQFGYFVRRCASEGTSKAKVAKMVGGEATSTERSYVTHILAPAVVRYVRDAARTRSVEPLGKAAAIAVGLGATGQRFVRQRATDLIADRRAR